MTQLAFDLDLEQGFPEIQTPELGGRCSTCGRTLQGRYSRCHGSIRGGVWFAWCDECSQARRAA